MDKNFITYFNFGCNLFFLSILFIGSMIYADSNGVFHQASDVRGGIFGSDEQDVTTSFTFANQVFFNNNISYFGEDIDERFVNENQANSINSSMIVDSAILGEDISNNSINGVHIIDGSIGSVDISDGAVGSIDLLDNNVLSVDIQDGTIASNDIGNLAVNTTHIQDGSIINSKIANNSIDQSKVQSDSVQLRVAGSCSSGSFMMAINSDGSVVCGTDNVGTSSSGSGCHPQTGTRCGSCQFGFLEYGTRACDGSCSGLRCDTGGR